MSLKIGKEQGTSVERGLYSRAVGYEDLHAGCVRALCRARAAERRGGDLPAEEQRSGALARRLAGRCCGRQVHYQRQADDCEDWFKERVTIVDAEPAAIEDNSEDE